MLTTKNTARRISFLLALIFILIKLYSQPFEIRATNKGLGVIGIEMRVTNASLPKRTDFITDIVFGIKWSNANDIDLSNNFRTEYNILKAGARNVKNNYYFQAFYAEPIGFNPPVAWELNTWNEILSIPVELRNAVGSLFEICELGFDITTDPNFGVNFTDYTPLRAGTAGGVLIPVKLISFEVKGIKKVINVQWTTAHEQNCKGFEVQRSETEVDHFKMIGWLDSKGDNNIKNNYEFLDKNVVARVRYYYRLKQIDKDGSFKYSMLKTAILDELDNATIRISPNPAGKILTVYFTDNNERGEVNLKIIDSNGSQVLTKSYQLHPNMKVELNVSNFTGGAYFLLIESREGLIYAKSFHKAG